ncbi:hypothetical protein [Halostagnicola kamekurae]|uniref:Uncharacterized protein n=1 Tax=Halostagnicola kamekurae TaxID=619731 RepID=A0A1I6SRF6_9EURY|nr:hypothetical protein [Halostagnicola kamekurae]SFS79500.1 hypothetical protein SAMN04488556_2860 [Halostagnicola kamekurae]
MVDKYFTICLRREIMKEKPDFVLVGISFAFGVVVTAGWLYGMTTAAVPERVVLTLSAGFPFAWMALIALGTLLLGGWVRLPTDALLGGEILGTLGGFCVFAIQDGWGFGIFTVASLAILAIVLGAWPVYELNRRHGVVEEPVYGTWRYVFVALAIIATAIPLLLIG